MNTLKIKNAKILKSEKMNKTTMEHNKTSAPKNQIIVKDDQGDLHVVIWFQFLGHRELSGFAFFDFEVKETSQGWIVKDVEMF